MGEVAEKLGNGQRGHVRDHLLPRGNLRAIYILRLPSPLFYPDLSSLHFINVVVTKCNIHTVTKCQN